MSLLGVLIILLILFEIAVIVITIWQMTTYSIKEIPWQLWVNLGLIFVIFLISIGIGFAYYRESNITKILTHENLVLSKVVPPKEVVLPSHYKDGVTAEEYFV